ncbi:MAG: DegT/DnrJ/EryC1/StrS family aminotransferase [Phycisphaerae bacterium]|jgi:dTDP-4-amino-4,6-dideoxygalactose transaminase|nr:DegT/DnrJ/EryC1/StrS family aminotransferase [Phycisphaerae bacterium]
MKKKLFVTEPSLPPLDEFVSYLEKIWASKWLTNNGAYHQQFEQALADHLGVKYVSLFTNGMLALQVGLQALRVTGEVITTPFTFPATAHAIYWNNSTPVFCDIEPDTFTLDLDKIESLITPQTTAILPVHVYGNPCQVERLQKIANTYGLKLFYDAAHAFGVEKDGVSILNHGDLSMLSFHATKAFNTCEGGALITKDKSLKDRIDFLKNFGFADEATVVAPGTNGKMDEVRSALGLLQLKYIDKEIAKTKETVALYRGQLRDVAGIRIMQDIANVRHNYSYFPILVDGNEYGMSRDALCERLAGHDVYPRKYFYPLVSQFASYRHLSSALPGKLPIAEQISEQVLCLPLFASLEEAQVNLITSVIREGSV